MLESTFLHRSTILSRAHEADIIRKHREANNGTINQRVVYEVLAMRRAPVRGL